MGEVTSNVPDPQSPGFQFGLGAFLQDVKQAVNDNGAQVAALQGELSDFQDARLAAEVAKEAAEAAAVTATERLAGMSTIVDGQVVAVLEDPDSVTTAALNSTYAKDATPSEVTGLDGNFDPRTSIYLPPGANVRKTAAKAAQVRAGVAGARCKIALQGHSEIAGFGSTVGVTSVGIFLRSLFASRYAVGTGFVPVFTNIGSGTTKDSRWVYTFGATAWEYTGSAAGGGNMHFHLRSSLTGKTATFTSDVAGTVAEIYTFGNSAAFDYSIDGGAPVRYTPSGAQALEVVTVTGLANTTHTVAVTTIGTAATFLVGAAVRPASAVEVAAFGLSGSRASDHLPTLPFFYNPYQVVDAYNPDCVGIQLDANEALNGISVTTFANNVRAIVDAHEADGRDVFLILSIGPNTVAAATWLTFRQALYDIADEKVLPLIDLTHRLGGYTAANGNGLMFDTTHPNGSGYADSAVPMGALLNV